MNHFPNFRSRPTFGTFLAAAGLFITGQSVAQEYALLTKPATVSVSGKESTKAFWKMTTPPGADSTLVEFYTPGNELIYQEKLPNPAVKLTKKNIRTLNETTDRLTGMNAATIPATTLSDALSGKTGLLQIGTYASKDGVHLHLMMENPAHDYVMVDLLNKDGYSVYRTGTRGDKAHYKFNLEGMPAGDYQLRVLGKGQHFERKLTFSFPQPDPNITGPRIAIN